MDGVEVFMSMSHREEDREWRREDRMWRKEDRIWRKLDHEWRQEDRKWRRNDRRYRQLEEARRKTDEWVEMINDIANVSALLAGFATAALVEAPLDQFWACYSETDDDQYFVGDTSNCEANRLNEKYVISIWFLALFAVATSMVAALMVANVLSAVQTATLLLQNYNKHPWRNHNALWDMIDNRWKWITVRFYMGMALSGVSIASLVVFKFANNSWVCWTSFSSVLVIVMWTLNDAVGLCYCCATCCPGKTKCCLYYFFGCGFCCGCKKDKLYQCCGCCEAPAMIVMTSNIRSSYRKNPLKGYHFSDDGIYDFEENEDETNDDYGWDKDLDEYRSRVRPQRTEGSKDISSREKEMDDMHSEENVTIGGE